MGHTLLAGHRLACRARPRDRRGRRADDRPGQYRSPAVRPAGNHRPRPTQGTVTWNDVRTRPAEQAMVFQRPVLLRRSAEANLRYALALSGVHGVNAERRIFEALTEVGLLDLAKRSARVLSWGEQQRLALARVWALEPEVLFLDEPTASLDPHATRAVEQIVSDIRSEEHTSELQSPMYLVCR